MTSQSMLLLFFLKYKYNCLLFTINIHYFIITHFIHNQSSAGILSYLYYLQFKKGKNVFIPCRFLEAFHRIVRKKCISEHFNKKKFFSVLHIPDLTNSNFISAHGSAEHREKNQRAFKMKLKNLKKIPAKCKG